MFYCSDLLPHLGSQYWYVHTYMCVSINNTNVNNLGLYFAGFGIITSFVMTLFLVSLLTSGMLMLGIKRVSQVLWIYTTYIYDVYLLKILLIYNKTLRNATNFCCHGCMSLPLYLQSLYCSAPLHSSFCFPCPGLKLPWLLFSY